MAPWIPRDELCSRVHLCLRGPINAALGVSAEWATRSQHAIPDGRDLSERGSPVWGEADDIAMHVVSIPQRSVEYSSVERLCVWNGGGKMPDAGNLHMVNFQRRSSPCCTAARGK